MFCSAGELGGDGEQCWMANSYGSFHKKRKDSFQWKVFHSFEENPVFCGSFFGWVCILLVLHGKLGDGNRRRASILGAVGALWALGAYWAVGAVEDR